MKASLPIKDIEMIRKMKDLFLSKGEIKGYLLFVLSINTGINLTELLNLKVRDVKNKHYLNYGKNKSVPISEELKNVIKKVVNGSKLDDPLFQGRSGAQLDRTSAFYIFKTICAELGVQDKYSVASWRKTFAYHYYLKYKDLSYLQWLFNQGTVNQALNFLGIEENMNLRFREGVSL